MSYGSVTLVKVVFAQAMKGQDIVFLYLANNSPDVSWKNTIKKYKLLGEQVVHYNLLAKQSFFLFSNAEMLADEVRAVSPKASMVERNSLRFIFIL